MKRVRKIFVSYRRDDAAHPAGRIRDWFIQHGRIPREHVFMDVENILPGADFVQEINRAIAQCDAMIIVISPSWLVDVNQPGVSYPRLEAEAALTQARLKVVPVLASGAPLPTEAQLPSSLHPLLKLNIRAVRADSFDYDLGFVAKGLGLRARRRSLIAAGAVLIVAAGLAILSQVPEGNPIYTIFQGAAANPTQPSGSPTTEPTESPTTPPPRWQGQLPTELLKTALLDVVDVGPEFSRSGPDIQSSSYACTREAAAATALGDSRVGVYLSRPGDLSLKSRVILIREDLASFESITQANSAIAEFGEWKDRCRTPATAFLSTVIVNDRSADLHGDATSAALLRTNYSTLGVGPGSKYTVVVILRLSHTVCVLAFEALGILDEQGQPSQPDDGEISRYVAAAVDKLKTLT